MVHALMCRVFLTFWLANVAAVLAGSCSLDPEDRATHVDVLILGAGITGISAARTLEVSGITNFLVLEATDRIGGRIREYDGTSIEVGANWIHGLDLRDPNHHPIWREWVECDEDGPDGSVTPSSFSSVYNVMGKPYNISDQHGTYQKRKAVFRTAYKRAEKLNKILTYDISLRQGLKWGGWTPQTALDNFTEWVTCDFDSAITPEEASLLMYFPSYTYTAFLGPEKNATAIDYLVTDRKGYSFVTECLARNFKKDHVRLNSTITMIHTAEDCVCVSVHDGKHYCGRFGIVTFSIGVLHAAISGKEPSVHFEPPLPQWKQYAIHSATPVQYGKVHLLFNTSFWKAADGAQQTFGYVSDRRGYYAYYILYSKHPNMITVDITEELAVHVSTQSEKVTVHEVMTILRRIFGENIPDPYTAIISKWSTDPLFQCAYTAYTTGVSETVFDALLRPVNNSLYFAGEALNSSDYGYTHSGYGSGAYVARQISRMMSVEDIMGH